MKSQLQENLIKTSCKNCAFAVYEKDTQVDCAFGRIEKFKDSVTEAFDNEKEFFIVDRLCTYFRDKKWGYNTNDKTRVEEESAASFAIIFNCNEIEDRYFNLIQSFLENEEYYTKKYNVVLAHEYDKKIDDKILLLSKFFRKNVTVSCCYSFQEFANEHIMKNKSIFHAIINPENKSFSSGCLGAINNSLNEDLAKFVVAKLGDVYFVNNLLYKSFQTIDPCIDYKKNIDNIIANIKKSMYKEIENDN